MADARRRPLLLAIALVLVAGVLVVLARTDTGDDAKVAATDADSDVVEIETTSTTSAPIPATTVAPETTTTTTTTAAPATTTTTAPPAFEVPLQWSPVASSWVGTCLITEDTSVWCAGRHDVHARGDGANVDSFDFVPVADTTGVTALAGGSYHLCALRYDGTVRCWGSTGFGAMGVPAQPPTGGLPVDVPGLTGVRAITANGGYTCVLLADGTVDCWGAYPGGPYYEANEQRVKVEGLEHAVAISGGRSNACALLDDGTVHCWGIDPFGFGVLESVGLTDVTAVDLGEFGACAIRAAGELWCWGQHPSQTARGAVTGGYEGDRTPVRIDGLPPLRSFAHGYGVGCGVAVDASVWCWGDRRGSSLGDGTEVSEAPIRVPDLTDVIAVDAEQQQSCAIEDDGEVRCWGRSPIDATPSPVVPAPVLHPEVRGRTSP